MRKHTTKQGIYFELQEHQSPQKPLLVFLHGFLSSSFCYRKLIPLLQEDFSILTIDWPPFGKSTYSKGFIYSYENIAKAVNDLLNGLRFEEVVAVGHSMGGQIALHLTKNNPGKIKKIVLLASSSFLPKAKKSHILLTYLPLSSLWVKRTLAKQGVEQNLELCVYDSSIVTPEMIQGYEKPFLRPFIFGGILRLIRHREGDLREQELRAISSQALLLWGEHDKVVPLKKGKRLHSILPNSELIVYKKTGHLLPEEQPVRVANDIKKFAGL